jgi:sugar phosphate isomerase/epimerase
VADEKPQLLINVPYEMVRTNVARLTALQVGAEIYLNNRAVDEADRMEARRIGRELADRSILCTVHGPYMDLTPGSVDKDIRRITREKLKKAVEIAHLLGARGVVCHNAYDRWRYGGLEETWLDNSAETWAEILKDAGDMPLMIENIFDETPEIILALLERFDKGNLWVCFDTGHFNLFTTLPLEEWLVPLKERIREFHIHDNHGKSDEHLPVGQGLFPFRELKAFLQPSNGILFTAEAGNEAAAMETIRCAKEFLS